MGRPGFVQHNKIRNQFILKVRTLEFTSISHYFSLQGTTFKSGIKLTLKQIGPFVNNKLKSVEWADPDRRKIMIET